MYKLKIAEKFERMGARVKFNDHSASQSLSLNVRSDREGEYFEVSKGSNSREKVEVLDVQPRDRHLLLLVRGDDSKNKLLCGHDERHWFVAGIPETAPVGTVRQAKESLKPAVVRHEQVRKKVRKKKRNRRKNEAFIRQGEWFFIPADNPVLHEYLVLKNEPLSRGAGSKPHMAEFCYREGGEDVYVCSRYPNGVSFKKYKMILSRNSSARNWGWNRMKRNPSVYVKGKISHADHKTIHLHEWCLVVMNTENQSQAMRHVAFLD